MEVKAQLKNLRVSPRKVRLVAGLIRGKNAIQAKQQLTFLVKRSSDPMLKLLNSAIANAKNNAKLSEENLIVSKIFVDGGPVLKRHMPRAFGRAFAIRKRTSHVTIVLSDKSESKLEAAKEIKAEKAEKKSEKEVKSKKTATKKKTTKK